MAQDGYIRETNAGTWEAGFRDPDGRQVTKTFKLKGDATTWKRAHLTAMDTGDFLDPKRGEVRMETFFTEEFLPGSDLRPTTLDRYQRHYRLYIGPAFGAMRLNSITPGAIRKWRSGLKADGVGAPTIASGLRLLKTILNRAVNDDRIPRSPARKVENKTTSPKGGLRVLEPDELATLAESIEPRYTALVYLLAYKGLRIGEAAALRVGDVNTMTSKVSITKTLSEVGGKLVEGEPKTASGIREVTLPAFLRDIMAAHMAKFTDATDPNAYVFPGPGGGPGHPEGQGGPLRSGNFRKRHFYPAVVKMVKTIEDTQRRALLAKLGVHDLRDTAATLAFKSGATPKAVADMLGHSDPSITLKIYTGVLESMNAETDDKLDAAFRAATAREVPEDAVVVSITG